MYKTTRSAQLPEYGGYSPRDEDYTQPGDSTCQSQYRLFSMSQHSRTTGSQSGTSFSDDISLTPSTTRSVTQDLADFLKTSSPVNYKGFLGSSSSEDLPSFGVSKKRSFRFLRSSASKSSPIKHNTISVPSPLPNKNVVSKITSRGKPYLQIKVDYDEGIQSHTTITASQQSNSSSEISSDKYQRDSIITSNSTSADSGISFQVSYADERPSLRPALPRNALESRLSLDKVTMGRYQQFLDSGDHKTFSIESFPDSPTDIVSAGMEELRAFQEFQRLQSRNSQPYTLPAPRNTNGARSTSPRSPPQSHSLPNSTSLVRTKSQASARSSVTSDIFDDITDTEFEGTAGPNSQRKRSWKTPSRPGPPPNRGLPSLPEGHDDSIPKSPEKRHQTLSVRHSQASFASSTTSTYSNLDDARSIKSDRKSREERVKARKAKDLNKHLQMVTEKKTEACNDGGTVSEPNASTHTHQPACNASGEESQLVQGSPNSGRGQSGNRNFSIPIQCQSPTSITNSCLPKNSSPEKDRAPVLYRQDLGSPNSQNEIHYLSGSQPLGQVPRQSAREIELEARMLAVERKNKMLEQALMAVIRSAVRGQAQRRAELSKANVLEELLDEMDLDEFPAAFSVGGRVD